MRAKFFALIALGIALLGQGRLFADVLPIMQPNLVGTQVVQSLPSPNVTQDQAKQWGLNIEDYQHYLWLMKNTPSGKWYAQLDPSEVLALNAENQDEMTKYAQIQARNMHVRVTKELAFNRLYAQAYQQFYPNEKPIQPNLSTTFSSSGLALQPGDRIWFFTPADSSLSSFIYQHLIKKVQQTPNTVLDIYFVGTQINQHAIQEWASAMGIPKNMVNQQVTLNYGNDRFQSIAHGKSINLPYIGVVHHQNFQAVTVSSVL